jgi:HK97 gp10 family phage protein
MARRRDKNRISEIAAELPPKIDVGIAKGAVLVMQYAKMRAPVRTGRLRNAIHVEREGFAEHAVVAGDRDAFYGHIVEHGGAHSGAHPFLIPAVESARKEVQRIVAETIDPL